jgi:hypothetical protein
MFIREEYMNEIRNHDLYEIALEYYNNLSTETRQKLRRFHNLRYLILTVFDLIIEMIIIGLCIFIYFTYLSKGIVQIPLPDNQKAPALLSLILLVIFGIFLLLPVIFFFMRSGILTDSSVYFEKEFFKTLKRLRLHNDYFIPHGQNTKKPKKIYWKDLDHVNFNMKLMHIDYELSMKSLCLEFHLKDSTFEGDLPYLKVASKIISTKPTLLSQVIKDFCEEMIKRNSPE